MADYTPGQEVRVKDLLKLTDYYQILGLAKHSSPSQLKKAYLKLAKEFHPDRNKAPGSTKATQLLVRAYTVLSDPEEKRKYDENVADYEVDEEDLGDFNFEDFENFFRHFETQMVYEENNKAADPESTKKFCLFFCSVFAIMILLGYITMKTNFRNNPEAGLHHLWGREALDRLREHVDNGDIEDFRVKAMARNMGTLKIYSKHHSKLYTAEILEKMLKHWFKILHYRIDPAESKRMLISVLEKSQCSSDVVTEMKNILEEKNLWERPWSFVRGILAWSKVRPYEVELEVLFGEFVLERLRNYVERGEISGESLEKMAKQMGVQDMFSYHYGNIHNGKMFQKILEEWFRQTLHRLQPVEAKKSLIFALKISDCSAPLLEDIESALFEPSTSTILYWWKVRKYFNIFLRQILFHY